MERAFDHVEEALGYVFKDKNLLVEALTHPSWAAETPRCQVHNQRLEFLGDAVLQLAVTTMLFENLPEESEGPLTKLRSVLTKEEALVAYAGALDLRSAVRLGKGEIMSGGRDRPSILGDAFEALLGAVFLDGGWPAAARVTQELANGLFADVQTLLAAENPKGALQEFTQEKHRCIPEYTTVAVTGPDHEPRFEVAVSLQGRELARATAGSRRAAESRAAQAALENLTETADEP